MAIKDITEEVNQLRHDSEMRKMCFDSVNHPPHYNSGKSECECGRRIECIDVTQHMNFNLGNAMKYLWRAEHKGFKEQDLRKAVWYIECEIRKHQKELESCLASPAPDVEKKEPHGCG